ncbi:ATP-dependent zinc metalloprotease FtsH [Naasia lichenicola]|uniref:ATP-dependent zinc metalloprotease FtsH n=1 Tax=Naasia lichenicola TaxID=2565933 RepID=UPI0018EEBB06|nr:ATP-dependent zinc metalloprotease FtsH [Naasia lichenicola]
MPAGFAITAFLLLMPNLFGAAAIAVDYGDLVGQLETKKVDTLVLSADGGITGVYVDGFEDGASFTSRYPTAAAQNDPDFLAAVTNPTIVPHFRAIPVAESFLSVLLSFLPLALLIGYFIYVGRVARKGGGMLGGAIGRMKPRVIDTERPTTKFSDVAGYAGVKKEISEVVDFLRDAPKYAAAGAVGPKGVLMSGPPGTGKTLLARAVAGEANVAFLPVTGSSFIELYVGVGASRVRDLFAEARKRSPSIIFIDEIDGIGQRRGNGQFGGNDEREQTLNQLLAEMDGFDPSTGVVVLAATNRPETLDPALLRPGRFDRQVTVPLPNAGERAEILAVHARGKKLAASVDLGAVARSTPGFSGADLANLVNEAAIFAVRDSRTELTREDFAGARDRILLGQRLGSNFLLEDERKSVAFHESGHALVAALTPGADPVDKVTILPSGMALGVTEQIPDEERHLYTEERLRASLAVRLGGRAAELVVFGQGSTGASNDLASATQLATRMVSEFGLSPELGPVGYSSDGPRYLGVGGGEAHAYGEATQRVIDTEVARLMREAEARAIRVLTENRAALDRLADELLAHETVDGAVVRAVAMGGSLAPS